MLWLDWSNDVDGSEDSQIALGTDTQRLLYVILY